jgi:hypothetical protein
VSSRLTRWATVEPSGCGEPARPAPEDFNTLVKGPGEEEREDGFEPGRSGGNRWKVNGVEIGWIGAELRVSVRIRFCASLGGFTPFPLSSSCLGGITGETLEPSLRLVGGVM